jgi:hypothetical protein
MKCGNDLYVDKMENYLNTIAGRRIRDREGR